MFDGFGLGRSSAFVVNGLETGLVEPRRDSRFHSLISMFSFAKKLHMQNLAAYTCTPATECTREIGAATLPLS